MMPSKDGTLARKAIKKAADAALVQNPAKVWEMEEAFLPNSK
jgi:hypothetical protein